jgi:hypothetical protein
VRAPLLLLPLGALTAPHGTRSSVDAAFWPELQIVFSFASISRSVLSTPAIYRDSGRIEVADQYGRVARASGDASRQRDLRAACASNRGDRVSAASLSLRVQQTLEALDIFRVAAGLPIIRVTEMLHHTTFWKVRVPMLHNCPNFSSQNSRGTGRWQT